MKLDYDKIKQITLGAVSVNEETSGITFSRFTPEQQEMYRVRNADFYNKTFAPAGVKLSFKTDSKNLFVKIKAIATSSRTYFSVDVCVNGKLIGSVDNFSGVKLERNYTVQKFELGEFSGKFELGDGEKDVCVHFPWSVRMVLEELSVDDDCYVKPLKPQKTLLVYGDSITQGYDAMRPSNRYISKLADKLCAEEFNKAIGGEIFFPELAKYKDEFKPDLITVAYGTNDWAMVDSRTFKDNCRGFFENLAHSYPDIKIFAITPIWRKLENVKSVFGTFENIEMNIKEQTEHIKNVIVISGADLVPCDENYYADLCLHPKDEGFEYYSDNLFNKLKTLM